MTASDEAQSDATIPAAEPGRLGCGRSKRRNRRSSAYPPTSRRRPLSDDPRSRSIRFAALALELVTPLTVAAAVPAFGSGDSAVVEAVLTDGNVHVESTKGLSRVTVVLCDGDPVIADDWDEDQKSGDVTVDGVVRAVFIHSGDNTTAEAQALLALLAGADAVHGNSTGAIAIDDEDACEEPEGGDNPGGGGGGGDNPGGGGGW